MAKRRLDNIEFSGEYANVFKLIAESSIQLKKHNEIESDNINNIEGTILDVLYFKDLTYSEKLIREQLINVMRSLIDLHYMLSDAKK